MSDVTRPRALELLRRMVLLRRFEEACAEAYVQQKIRGFLHLYVGEEAVAVGAMDALREEDAVVATYREHGHALLRGVSTEAAMAEMFGKVTGCARGRGGSMHLFDAVHRFYGGYAIVGGGLSVAVGLALADRLQGKRRVTACFFGDGATAEGAFHESLNLASLWRLPVLFLCENNQYAMGTALARYSANPRLVDQPRAHLIESERVDGMDVLAVAEVVGRAASAVREDGMPRFVECETYRFRAHSMYDAEKYRDKAEVEGWKKRDPIATFVERMKRERVLEPRDVDAIEAAVAAQIADAVRAADAAPVEPVEDLAKDVYAGVWP